MRDDTKIDGWRYADDLTVAIYERSRAFPKEETYGLTSQLRRAVYSVPANIAEGSARESQRDYLRFTHIARGSLTETQYFLHLSHRPGYLSAPDHERLAELTKTAFACLHGLIRAVEKEASLPARASAAVSIAALLLISRLIHCPRP